jgi:hypothetical protein
MTAKETLDRFLGRNTRITERSIGPNQKEVCDLDTNECYVISVSDGLIERVDNTRLTNKNVQVKTNGGIKQLLND